MISILLKDFQKKLMQEMLHLRDETELLICQNIRKIDKDGNQLNIETLAEGVTEYWIKRGFILDNSLYDRLIIEYNQNNADVLTRWK